MRIDRMLAITVILLNKDRVSARELADRFEVSVRTIYRDVDAISMAGIPITSYAGKQGGFKIIDSFKLDRQLLTMKDMLAMLSALKGINATLENEELDSAIDKITCLIPDDKTSLLEDHLQHISIDILPWGTQKKQQKFLKQLHNSVAENNIIEFQYENSKGEIRERRVEPMTLIFKGYAWYLFSFCLYRNDYRLFRLSRMKDVNITEEKFIRREKTHKEYFKESFKSEELTEIVLKCSRKIKQKIIEFFGEENVQVEENGDLIVNFSAPDDEWIYSIILSFGEYVEVLEPEHIRSIIKEKAEKIFSNYKHDIMVSQP
ncbi:MAG: YafY family transcriptional regulator [Ignavibacteriae bacterium]|nr:YafY family transcriptional regulator [Ignavibacteriota bacterium]